MPASHAPAIAHVVLDLPLPGWFDYQVPEALALGIGDWVIVPWARGRRVGLVVGLASSTEVPAVRLKALQCLLLSVILIVVDLLILVMVLIHTFLLVCLHTQ